jgi:hypothetical protein
VRRRELLAATIPGKCQVYALLNGQLAWGGWVTERSNDDDPDVKVTEMGAYWNSVLMRQDMGFANVDQLQIVRDIIANHQGRGAGFDVRTVVDGQDSGVRRDRSYFAGDRNKIGERISELSAVENGFDFAWEPEYDSTRKPRIRLRLGYPRLGSTAPSLTLDIPGKHVQDGWSFTEGVPVTHSWAIGDAPAGSQTRTVATASSSTLIAQGFPVVDRDEAYSNVSTVAVLQGHANADQQAYGGSQSTLDLTVSLEAFMEAPTRIGDNVSLSMRSDRFPDPFDATWRLTAFTYQPSSSTVKLTLRPRLSLGGRVPEGRDLESLLAGLVSDVRQLSVSQQ